MHAWDATKPEQAFERAMVRNAVSADYAALLSMWRELMDLHVSLDARFDLADQANQRFRNYIDTAITREDYRVRLAEVDGVPAGFSVSCVLPNSPVYRARWIGYINDLCVTTSMRRLGVGRILVRDAVAWLRRYGAESIEVYVAHHNKAARQFWRDMGGRPYLHRMSLDPHVVFNDDE